MRDQTFNASLLRVLVVVVDNDEHPGARPVCDEVFGADSRAVEFVHCPRTGIPIARNAAIEAALRHGAEFIAFLDDDEIAPPNWLEGLFDTLQRTGLDALQGGVRKYRAAAEGALPDDQRTAKTNLKRRETLATCNVLFRTRLVRQPLSLRFDEKMRFTGGSDREFFMRAHKAGARLMRTDDHYVFELVPDSRQSFRYECMRAYASGCNYYTRIGKNEALPKAMGRILGRILERVVVGLVQLGHAAILTLASRKSALNRWRKGCAGLAFAAGCCAAPFGLRGYPYKNVQGV